MQPAPSSFRTHTPWVAVGARSATAVGVTTVIAVLSSLWELAALAGVAIGAEAWRVVSEPSTVAITNAGLETRGRLGRRRLIPWSAISELVCRPDTEAPSGVRILSSVAQVRLTGRNDGFALVLAEIRGRVPGVTLTRRVWYRG